LEKAKFNCFCGVFLKIVNLAAVICIVFLLADIARSVRHSGNPNEQEKSNISNEVSTKSKSPIILLSTTIAEVESKDNSVSNESEIKTEPEPQKVEKVQTIPENAATLQPDDSESNTERNIELPGEWESIEMRVTAYCPCPSCCGEYSDGITANGYEIQPGDTFVAADRRYPFDTEMLIPGYSNSQPVKVLDRGGAIKGNRLDVFFATHQEALQWGVQYLKVNVCRKNL
jgi:3D (Asp-Asp-Asp) domain-containing protein